MVRRFAPLVLVLAAVAAAACATTSFDIGSNEPVVVPPKTVDAGTPPPRIYGCVDWNDDEVLQKRGPACASSCPAAAPSGDRFDIKTQGDVVAVTANRWMFCNVSPFTAAPEAVGMEFTPGCRIYLLRRDDEGNLVRGTEARHQASFDIYVPGAGLLEGGSAAPVIDLHINAQTTKRYALESAKCPTNWLTLTEEGVSDPALDVRLRPVDEKDLVQPQL